MTHKGHCLGRFRFEHPPRTSLLPIPRSAQGLPGHSPLRELRLYRTESSVPLMSESQRNKEDSSRSLLCRLSCAASSMSGTARSKWIWSSTTRLLASISDFSEWHLARITFGDPSALEDCDVRGSMQSVQAKKTIFLECETILCELLVNALDAIPSSLNPSNASRKLES